MDKRGEIVEMAEKGFAQHSIAKALRVSPSYVSHVLAGHRVGVKPCDVVEAYFMYPTANIAQLAVLTVTVPAVVGKILAQRGLPIK